MERRAPALAEVGIASGWAGLYEMTPDHNALIGEAAVGRAGSSTPPASPATASCMGPAVGEVVRDLVPRPPARSSTSAASTPAGSPTRRPAPSSTSSSSLTGPHQGDTHGNDASTDPQRRRPAGPGPHHRRGAAGSSSGALTAPPGDDVPDQRRAPALPGVGRRRSRRRRGRARAAGVPGLADGAGARRAAPLVKRLGELLRRAQGRPRHAGQPRGRQDHLRGAAARSRR